MKTKISKIKKELIEKINKKVAKEPINIQEENLMAQFIDKYQYEQIVSVEKGKVNTEDAEGVENEFTLDELDVETLQDIHNIIK